jgi:large conductance mechanosensitive channel
MIRGMSGIWKEFREFVLRGNLVDLAIAVVLGAAFGAVVSSLVSDISTPLIAAIGGKPDFGSLTFKVGRGVFRYGDFLNALLYFVIVASVIFFLVVKPVNALLARVKLSSEEPESPAADVVLLAEIRDLLRTARTGSRPPAPRGEPPPTSCRLCGNPRRFSPLTVPSE